MTYFELIDHITATFPTSIIWEETEVFQEHINLVSREGSKPQLLIRRI